MADDIPQWAIERAWLEVQARVPSEAFSREAPKAWMETFALYIAAHEEAPVDPLLIEAREIVKATFEPRSHNKCNCREKIDAGDMDSGHRIRAALAALKRGIELAGDRNA